MRAAATAVLVASLLLLPGRFAAAAIPKPERISGAAATANKTASRGQALQLDLTLRVADREPIGSGRLVTHPTGLARLELRDAAGHTERHLLLGTEHSASRGGNELAKPRAFLPPLFFLQVSSPTNLEQALADFGLDLGAAGIAPCGESICYVLGDPERAVPQPPAPPAPDEQQSGEGSIEFSDEADAAEREGRDRFLFDTMLEPAPHPAVWVNSKSFEIVRIESSSGVAVDFGPTADFNGIRFPSSITIHEPERDPVRFDILDVTAVNAPAAGFTRVWLLTPDASDEAPRAPASPTPMGSGRSPRSR